MRVNNSIQVWNFPAWKAFLFVLASTSLSGCNSPVLTSGTLEGSPSSQYLYGALAWAEERDTERFKSSFPLIIKIQKDNTTNILLSKISNSNGICLKSNTDYKCYIDGIRISNDCFRSICDRTTRVWRINISWRDTEGAIIPKVSVKLKVTRTTNP